MLFIDPGSQFSKATPSIEGGERVLYMEASNQARDLQNETILADALNDSRDYFLKFGRIDLDHATMYQMIREMRLDPGNPYAREIGQPVDVRYTNQNGNPRIWVKSHIFSSSDPKNEFVRAANWFWQTLQVSPRVRWYPSVSGALLPGGRVEQPDGRRVIKSLRWHSIALTRNPVNPSLSEVSTVPLEVFCKALREGSDLATTLSMLSSPEPPIPGIVAQARAHEVVEGITPEKATIIRQSIVDAVPPYRVDEWLLRLSQAGIKPAEGMAYLIALLDGGHQLAL